LRSRNCMRCGCKCGPALKAYDVEVHYKPGKEVPIADALSRLKSKRIKNDTGTETGAQIDSINVLRVPISQERLGEIKAHTRDDHVLRQLGQMITKGWPENPKLIPD